MPLTDTFDVQRHRKVERKWTEMIQKYTHGSWGGYVNVRAK